MTYRVFLVLMFAILLLGIAILAYGLMNPTELPRLTWGILRASGKLCHG